MSRKLYIAVPVNSGQMMISTVISIICSIRELVQGGWEYPVFYFRVGDSDLARARNAIIGHFLKSDCTDLVMIDSDISWPPGALTRLVSHKKDFVAGAYRGRTDDRERYFVLWPEQKEMWTDPETGNPLLKVDGVAIGFCRVTRDLIQKMVDASDGKMFRDPLIPDEEYPWLIDFSYFEGSRYEEGYSFCRKWRDLGGDVWVDPMINLGHMGPKIFQSDLVRFLEKMQHIARFTHPNEVQASIQEALIRGIPVAAE